MFTDDSFYCLVVTNFMFPDDNFYCLVVTVGTSGLPPDLRKLKRQFNVKLVSFENAMISLPPFRQFRYFETFSFLVETLSKFYLG